LLPDGQTVRLHTTIGCRRNLDPSTSVSTSVTDWIVSRVIRYYCVLHSCRQCLNCCQRVCRFTRFKKRAIQVRPSSETDLYPHMPILRPHAARFHERRISSVTFTSVHLYGNVYIRWAWPARRPIRPILGFWRSKVHKNVRFPALDDDELPCKI